jgi:hypothetical protein
MKTRLVILANSFREGDRCIAGINIRNGQWIRPVSASGAISRKLRSIAGREPVLLDIVEMSLQDVGPDQGCQPENRLLNPVPWQKVGVLTIEQVIKYCEDDTIILHNENDCVDESYFCSIQKSQWKSLQLVHSTKIVFHSSTWENKKRWRASFQYGKGGHIDLGVTDPIIIERLNKGTEISKDCLITISLAGPWSPSSSEPKRCYKLIAGVIEL